MTVVSETYGEFSKGPEDTSDSEANDGEETAKMKSNEKFSKDGNDEQRDIDIAVEVGLAIFVYQNVL